MVFKFDQVNARATVHVSVTVKTVRSDATPVYLDGADLPQITAKNVESTSDVLISWRFEKSCLLLANDRFRSQGTGECSLSFFVHPFYMTPVSVFVCNIRQTLMISISFCHFDSLLTSRF